MSAIIKIRNEQGNIVEIPILKGDKGEQGIQGLRGLQGEAGTTDYNELENKPNLSTVAISGSYNDLLNKPSLTPYALKTELPTKTSQLTNDSNFVNTTQLNLKADSSSLSTVATTGSYNDLTNKPTLPTKVSDLVNDNGYLTSVPSTYALKTYVDTKVSDLVSSAPATLDTLNELATALGNDPNFATTVSNQIGLKANASDVNSALNLKADSSSLKAVATSGSYNDLINKPEFPTELPAKGGDADTVDGKHASDFLQLSNGELQLSTTTSYGQMRLVCDGNGVILRNDGARMYFLPTRTGVPYGEWDPVKVKTSIRLDNGYLSCGGDYRSQNGYVWLPDGALLQWGVTGSTSGDYSVYFPIAFSNCFTVVGTSSTTDYKNVPINLHNNVGFVINSRYDQVFRWMAIGM